MAIAKDVFLCPPGAQGNKVLKTPLCSIKWVKYLLFKLIQNLLFVVDCKKFQYSYCPIEPWTDPQFSSLAAFLQEQFLALRRHLDNTLLFPEGELHGRVQNVASLDKLIAHEKGRSLLRSLVRPHEQFDFFEFSLFIELSCFCKDLNPTILGLEIRNDLFCKFGRSVCILHKLHNKNPFPPDFPPGSRRQQVYHGFPYGA